MTERARTARQRQLWSMHDFSAGRGLEIGPLHQASVLKSDADVIYLDVFDRATLVSSFESNPKIDPARIPEIDHVLFDGDRFRTLPETVEGTEPFDWVMASHVIEHVPDVIGWLRQVAEVTRDGGKLVLVVPDRRYCFDVHRPGTTTGQLLQAHESGDVVPSTRAVYDYARGHVGTTPADTWAGRPPSYKKRLYDLPAVLEKVDRARKGEYVDVHTWTFTPGSLVEQLVELREIGHSEWAVATWRPTRRGALEFFVVLTRLSRSGEWPSALFAGEPSPPLAMPDWLEEQTNLHAALTEARATLVRKDRQVRRLKQRVAQLDRQVVATRSSWRYRIGDALLRPVSRLRRVRRG